MLHQKKVEIDDMHKVLFFRSEADGKHFLQVYLRERSRGKDRQSASKKENSSQRQARREEGPQVNVLSSESSPVQQGVS